MIILLVLLILKWSVISVDPESGGTVQRLTSQQSTLIQRGLSYIDDTKHYQVRMKSLADIQNETQSDAQISCTMNIVNWSRWMMNQPIYYFKYGSFEKGERILVNRKLTIKYIFFWHSKLLKQKSIFCKMRKWQWRWFTAYSSKAIVILLLNVKLTPFEYLSWPQVTMKEKCSRATVRLLWWSMMRRDSSLEQVEPSPGHWSRRVFIWLSCGAFHTTSEFTTHTLVLELSNLEQGWYHKWLEIIILKSAGSPGRCWLIGTNKW